MDSDLGKYGRMRLRYLQDHKSELYAALLMAGCSPTAGH